ncbi:hypothetical protein OH492_12300 [Vibrio chagasii]|nr:hypothetical protein [Vibrio chagasii]
MFDVKRYTMCTLSEICYGKGLAVEPTAMCIHATTMFTQNSLQCPRQAIINIGVFTCSTNLDFAGEAKVTT